MYNYFIGPHYCNHAADFLFKKKIPYIAFKDKKKLDQGEAPSTWCSLPW